MKTIQTPVAITESVTPAQHSATSPSALSPVVLRHPPCASGPGDWDLDVGTPDSWREAVRTCHGCPLLGQCSDLAQTLTARGLGPRSMIWAGIAYDGAGRVVENLDRHRVAPLDHKRPLRIIRNGKRPLQVDHAQGVPQRHLVLGRRLRPTGTEAM